MIPAAKLEAEFEAFIKRLLVKPTLIDSYRRRAYNGPSPKLLERTIAETRAELAKVAKAVNNVWDLHTAGRIRDDDMQARLDAVTADRGRLNAQLEQLQRDHAMAIAAAAPIASENIKAELKKAVEQWSGWPSDVKRLFARALSAFLGGLCLEANGRLVARAVSPRAARTRHA
jgi:hypothetical protein